jgi:hypothetical protein
MRWTVTGIDQGYYWVMLVADDDHMVKMHPIPFQDAREAQHAADRLNKNYFPG